jgi:uncharacterized protein (UPF0332 family)
MSVNRSYYATFHGATAILEKKGIKTKKHAGTNHQFGLEYVINGDFDNQIAKIFSEIEDFRENSDMMFTFMLMKKMQLKF